MNRKYNYRKLKPKEYNSLKRVINDTYQAAGNCQIFCVNRSFS
ncbi:hypothetical protein LHEJCM1005_18220 [Lactobacillus helveticus]|nr:hypothetical protein LHEJCM1005_18220 [Lactobacillus helveticus]